MVDMVHSGLTASIPGGDEAGGAGHTPGPWEVVRINERGQHTPDGKSLWVYAGNGNGWVGDSYMSVCLGSKNGAEANARLIAAAPELLAVARLALKTILDAAEARDFDPPADPILIAELEAAIAKATAGETRNAEGAL